MHLQLCLAPSPVDMADPQDTEKSGSAGAEHTHCLERVEWRVPLLQGMLSTWGHFPEREPCFGGQVRSSAAGLCLPRSVDPGKAVTDMKAHEAFFNVKPFGGKVDGH